MSNEDFPKKMVELTGGQINHLLSLCSQELANLNRHSINAGVPVSCDRQEALKELINALESEDVPDTYGLTAREVKTANERGKIFAIKLHRERTGSSLVTAKALVEWHPGIAFVPSK